MIPEPSMPEPPRAYMRVIETIDAVTEWTGKFFTILLIPLIAANVIEVVMRYVFGNPTSWAYDTTTMTYAALFMLGAAITLRRGAHIRTDILWDQFSDRTKGIIDAVAYLALFLPSMIIILIISIDGLMYSLSIDERSTVSTWNPVLWPLRAVVPLAAVLLIIQGISEFLKVLWAARTGRSLTAHDKTEL